MKTSCAFDYRVLEQVVTGPSNHSWRHLAPCDHVVDRWNEALRQLGHANPAESVPTHQLVLKDKRVVPFPSDFGIANVHLVHDRRVDILRKHQNAKRMKTPPICIKAGRSCWNCMEVTTATDKTASVADVGSHAEHA